MSVIKGEESGRRQKNNCLTISTLRDQCCLPTVYCCSETESVKVCASSINPEYLLSSRSENDRQEENPFTGELVYVTKSHVRHASSRSHIVFVQEQSADYVFD